MSTRQQLAAEDEAEILAHRQGMVAELARLKAEQLAALLPLAKAEERASAKLDRAHDALQAAHIALQDAMSAHAGCSNLYTHKLGKLERELTSTAPAAIASFVAEMHVLADRVSAPSANFRGPDPYFTTEERRAYDKALRDAQAARTDRLARIRQAITAADSMRLEALDSDTLSSRLDALRASTEETVEGSDG